MGAIYQQFQQAQGATTQVFAYLDRREERDAGGSTSLPPFSHDVEFDGVNFSYDSTPIAGINFSARKGEVVAFVGSSERKNHPGQPDPRFYEPTAYNSNRRHGYSWRNAALLPRTDARSKENILFHGYVWNNISYGWAPSEGAQRYATNIVPSIRIVPAVGS